MPGLKQKLALRYLRARLHILELVSVPKAASLAFRLFCTPPARVRKKPPPVFKTGEKLSFHLDGLEIRGRRWNHPQPRRLLLVHGFQSAAQNLAGFIEPAIRQGYEVIAFDAPAHGASQGKRITLPRYIRALQAIYDQYGPMDAYLAHSFGGLALSQFLETRPHDEHTRVVLIAPATETSTAIDDFFRLFALSQPVQDGFNQIVLQKAGVPASHLSVRRALHHIRARVLWFHDRTDKVTPLADVLPVQEDGHPNLRLVITEGLGHRRIYRDEQVMQQVQDFLR